MARVGDVRLDTVPDPRIQQPADAGLRLTASAICGTDLHFVRGTFSGMKPSAILGHERVGVVEQLKSKLRNLKVADRVVISATMACRTCSYCRAGYYGQCDNANPNGRDKRNSFFGAPVDTGPIDGPRAERGRIPFAAATMVKPPDAGSDEQAILISNIVPTGWYGALPAQWAAATRWRCQGAGRRGGQVPRAPGDGGPPG